jgi:hypothetical protein
MGDANDLVTFDNFLVPLLVIDWVTMLARGRA